MRLDVDGEEFHLDIFFFCLKLRLHVEIELKATALKPEYAGKVDFYLSADDDLKRRSNDKPSSSSD